MTSCSAAFAHHLLQSNGLAYQLSNRRDAVKCSFAKGRERDLRVESLFAERALKRAMYSVEHEGPWEGGAASAERCHSHLPIHFVRSVEGACKLLVAHLPQSASRTEISGAARSFSRTLRALSPVMMQSVERDR